MFSTRLRIPRRLPALRPLPAGRRLKHDVPRLPYDFSETGVPDLLSPHGFQLAWTMHMSSIVEKLNFLTEGTVLEDQHVKNILLATAREPEQAPLFNYASMAHNSHFFFSGLAPGGTPMSDALRLELEASFSSVDTLRREFVLTADAMFGPGFIWLVKAGPAEYRLLPTYLAGSPYPGAHWRAQPSDMNTLGNHGSAWDQFRATSLFRKKQDRHERQEALPPGGVDLTPLLCLNTWQHVWLFDYGFGLAGQGGKVAFAEAWWERIDWDRVAHRAGVRRPVFKAAAAADAAKPAPPPAEPQPAPAAEPQT